MAARKRLSLNRRERFTEAVKTRYSGAPDIYVNKLNRAHWRACRRYFSSSPLEKKFYDLMGEGTTEQRITFSKYVIVKCLCI